MNTVRKAIESMYKDTCNVYEWQKIKDPITYANKYGEVLVHENKKCKLSYSTITVTSDDKAATQKHEIGTNLSIVT